MGNTQVSQPTVIQRRAAAVRARFEAEGVTLAQWSRERGFAYGTVKQVITGNRPCKRGQSHKIAVALGIKDAPPCL
jgi:gp16 family phage-associated protein